MRQYKVFGFVIQVIIGVQCIFAGFERISQPTAVLSRAFTGAAMFASDNMLQNPASLGNIASFKTTFFYSPSPFQLEQLSNYGMMSSQNFELVNIAAGIQSFGFSLYRESAGSVGAAKMITNECSVGLNAHLYHLAIEKYGTSLTAVFDIGAIYLLTDQVNIGIALQNFTGSSFGSDDDIPQIMVSGISYRVLENAVVNVDLVKDVRYSLFYRAGVEFSPHEIFTLRAGTDGESSKLYGGIGILVAPFQINYGMFIHSELGLTHSIGITFQP